GDADAGVRALGDSDAGVRAAALGALDRCGRLDAPTLRAALADASPEVRRRAADLAASVDGTGIASALERALDDDDPLVVESACWALGERRAHAAVPYLSAVAAGHTDTRCREAAVAALGAVGRPEGLAAVLGALDDRPTVRRRATVALAAFSGGEVDEALRRSAADRDWQVREVAEILLDLDGGERDATPGIDGGVEEWTTEGWGAQEAGPPDPGGPPDTGGPPDPVPGAGTGPGDG
ncbi:MAG: HEAT repeat domain-containing protein, partial [Acidimicrobiales bacterium]